MNEFNIIKKYFSELSQIGVGKSNNDLEDAVDNVNSNLATACSNSLSTSNLYKEYFVDSGKLSNKQVNENHDSSTVALGIGDDCALLTLKPNCYMAISTDTFVEGTHFFKGTPAEAIAHKALAVNLSDLAAMGAKPLGYTLAITMPSFDEEFLKDFSLGLKNLASKWQVPLIGGDTTKGNLSITITVFGEITKGSEFKRNNAKVGDYICVSGTLGSAALAVRERYKYKNLNDYLLAKDFAVDVFDQKLDYPQPRLDLVSHLIAANCKCALDLSDGLLGDLNHILLNSDVSAILDWNLIPKENVIGNLPLNEQMKLVLNGGDDYELCFTISALGFQVLKDNGVEIFRVGEIISNEQLKGLQVNNKLSSITPSDKNIDEQNLKTRIVLKNNNDYMLMQGQGFSHF